MITYEMIELPHNSESNWLFVEQSVECGSIVAAESAAKALTRRSRQCDEFRIVWTVSRKSSVSALRTIYGKSLKREQTTSQTAKYGVRMNIYGEVI